MDVLSLNHGWRVIDTDVEAGDVVAMSAPGLDTSSWHAIDVPGDVNAVLVAAGRMPDPHIGDQARQCYWPSAKEWWYRLEFAQPAGAHGARTALILDGVDGHAEAYLNGQRVGSTNNAFHPWRFDVSGQIPTAQPNVLLIRFLAIEQVLGSPREHELYGWETTRCLMRKPQFSFGWDWALPLPSIGIAGGVRLEQWHGPRLLDVSVKSLLSGRVDFKFQLDRAAREADYQLAVRVHGHGEDVRRCIDRGGQAHSHCSLYLEDPQLWWPHDMGEQPLYEWTVDLIVEGDVVESRRGRLGIREVAILEEPFTEGAGPGISFWITVNGRRVFCKGGNWIPLSLWPAAADDAGYDFYLDKAARANFNMLRVWGGGVYERERFYDLCDERGIMVWQDFMFASSGYPVDRLRQQIMAEADYQVKRLRNRPCVVLWCGCNEDVYSWSLQDEPGHAMSDQIGEQAEVDRLRDDPQIYSMILRGTVSRLGHGVPYVESSPQSYEDAGNSPRSGNAHVSCWKYALFECEGDPGRFREYFDEPCSFDSEFCIQGPCNAESLKQFLPPEHHWPPDDVWLYHIQRGHGRIPHHEQTLTIAGSIFGPIDSLQAYVKHGQATHAEMMRAEFESARRDRPNNGGTMVWMFNDCWPTSNWSVIDFYRRPKPSYYAARRACAAHLPIIFERSGQVAFFFSNDRPDACNVQIVFGQQRLDGTDVWRHSAETQADGCETVRFHGIARGELTLEAGDYLYIDAIVDGRALPRVTYFPGMWKDVPWPAPQLTAELIEQVDADCGVCSRLRIRTDRYARFCHLILPASAEQAWVEDNFFDLCAGGEHDVTVWSLKPLDLGTLALGHWRTDWP